MGSRVSRRQWFRLRRREPAVVVCIPWRPTPDRLEAFSVVTATYESLGLTVVTADSDPTLPFNLSQARNNAVTAAGYADVYVVSDADTFPNPEHLLNAIRVAHRRGHLVHLAARYWAELADGNLPADPELYHAGGVVVVSRKALEAFGGWDERFTGWGAEDSAMLWKMATFGLYSEVDGDVFAFWHDRTGSWTDGVEAMVDATVTFTDAPADWAKNGPRPLPPLARAYRDALGDPQRMLSVLDRRV